MRVSGCGRYSVQGFAETKKASYRNLLARAGDAAFRTSSPRRTLLGTPPFHSRRASPKRRRRTGERHPRPVDGTSPVKKSPSVASPFRVRVALDLRHPPFKFRGSRISKTCDIIAKNLRYTSFPSDRRFLYTEVPCSGAQAALHILPQFPPRLLYLLPPGEVFARHRSGGGAVFDKFCLHQSNV